MQNNVTTQTDGQAGKIAPPVTHYLNVSRLTPERRQQHHAALIARMDALLLDPRHDESGLYAKWLAEADDTPGFTLARSARAREAVRIAFAALMPVMNRLPSDAPTPIPSDVFRAENPQGRAARRNERLVSRLLIRGLMARGEFIPRPEELAVGFDGEMQTTLGMPLKEGKAHVNA